jgi:HK97 family phage major capsid protein
MDEFDKKEMPEDKEKELDRIFDEMDGFTKKADRAAKANEMKSFFENPVHQHPVGAKDDDKQVKNGHHQKAFKAYLKEGKSGFGELNIEKKILSSLSDPEGGFLVPEEFRAQLIEKRRNLVFMRQMATVIQTSSQSVGVPTFDFDGDALWTAENAQIAEEDVLDAFGKQNFTPHKLARILRMPLELTEDAAINVESLMTDHFARRFGEIEENAFINGDGVEKPLGLLEAGLPTTNATAPVFEADDIFNIVYNIRAVYRANGSWMMHREAIRRIRTFVDGNGQYLWQPALTAGQPSTLLGYPLTESEFFPDNVTTGDAGDPLLIFGDYSFYWIVDRIDMSIQRLVERYAEFDQIGFKMRMRVDGAPTMADPIQVLVRV